jgi:hypothetical protein
LLVNLEKLEKNLKLMLKNDWFYNFKRPRHNWN